MKKIFALLISLLAFNSYAGLISIETNESSVAAGDVLSVSLIATDFDEFDVFDFDFNFNRDIFTFDDSSLQSDLPLDDGLFTLGLIYNVVDQHIAMSFFDFLPVSGDFLLAKFDLIATMTGTSEFSITNSEFYNTTGLLDVDVSARAQADVVAATQVSEPSTWLILMVSSLIVFNRRRFT